MSDVLALTADLPQRRYQAGSVILSEGTTTGGLLVLVDGSLAVRKGDISVATIDRPGAVVGEIAALLGSPHSASVVATTDAIVRVAESGASFLASSPEALRIVAVELARRLEAITAYLADLRRQYEGAPGLSMVGDVLATLTRIQGTAIELGSDREPDPEY